MSYKPLGYNSLSPYFIVAGAQRLIDLLQEIFDAEETRRFETATGSIMHAELRIDDSILMLSDATSEYPANQFLMHVYVPDVNITFEKALAAGCISLEAPKNREGDPDLRGMFQDFAGNVWAVATQKSE